MDQIMRHYDQYFHRNWLPGYPEGIPNWELPLSVLEGERLFSIISVLPELCVAGRKTLVIRTSIDEVGSNDNVMDVDLLCLH
jgi:hypothetical protein